MGQKLRFCFHDVAFEFIFESAEYFHSRGGSMRNALVSISRGWAGVGYAVRGYGLGRGRTLPRGRTYEYSFGAIHDVDALSETSIPPG